MDRPIKKLDDKRHSPFTIIKKEGESVYRLSLPKTWKRIHPVFNEKFLTPVVPSQYPSQQPPKPTPPIIVEGEEEYEIDELMDSRLSQGKLQYLVKWKDYPNRVDWTWEPESKILLENKEEFHEKHPSAPRRITAQLEFRPMPKPLTEVEVRTQTWPMGKETMSEGDFRVTQGLLPLLPQFFNEIETRRKTYEYRNYLFPDVRKMWLVNTETDMITHMIEVEKGEKHNDLRPDATPRQKYRYPITACHKLDTPLPRCSKIAIKGFETIVWSPTDKLTKIWVIRDDRL